MYGKIIRRLSRAYYMSKDVCDKRHNFNLKENPSDCRNRQNKIVSRSGKENRRCYVYLSL